jgi:phage terminase Nu1 subunit (DNA packaging protein)
VKALTYRSEGSEMVAAADIARVCGFTERHVTNLRKRGEMPPARQFGRLWRWHARTVARWLAGSAEYDLSTTASDGASPDDRSASTNPSKSRPQPRPGARSLY